MNRTTTIQLKNNLRELERLSQTVDAFGEANNLSPKILYALNLSLDEIITNVIYYGYNDVNEHQIIIRILLKDEELTVEVEDDGKPFNPLEAEKPDLEKPLEERQVGGLGIHLVTNLMDTLEYKRQGGKNLLIMKKKTRAS
ncbi:MAG TPA: ATP-binding protein [Candidatus Wunengus sp. YC60]|uniref:ATP-binding protein n=1 Tax=Candidatus Wunengus sp. YC60 TaxID=3367697 RepID=UPI00402729C8